MNRSLFLLYPSLRVLRIWLSMLRYHINSFDNRTIIFYEHPQDTTRLTFILAGINIYDITFFNM